MKRLLKSFFVGRSGSGSIEKALMFCAVGSLIYGISYSYAPDAKHYLQARLLNGTDTIHTASPGQQQTRLVRSVLPSPVTDTERQSMTGNGLCGWARVVYLDAIMGC